ncbi:unnamed protein product, partial [Ectocarpus fasciculatus]
AVAGSRRGESSWQKQGCQATPRPCTWPSSPRETALWPPPGSTGPCGCGRAPTLTARWRAWRGTAS